jgi:hypothetical protein
MPRPPKVDAQSDQGRSTAFVESAHTKRSRHAGERGWDEVAEHGPSDPAVHPSDDRTTGRPADATAQAQPNTQFRASHGDRQLVADRLREALDEGRLTLDEYDDRVKVAYAASTYDDLNTLLRDIPTQTGVLEIRPPSGRRMPAGPPQTAGPARMPRPAPRSRRIPLALSILWTIWAGIVAINVAVWLIVIVTTGHGLYPWPIWVAGPTGAALLAVTIGIQAIRNRPED